MSVIKKLRTTIKWEPAPKPDKKLLPDLYGHFKPFRLPIILTVTLMLIGTLGYIIIDDFPLMDAIYQTGITFTTVGFGEISEISSAGRIFTITLIIAGFAVFSSAIGILVTTIGNGEIAKSITERNMLYKIARYTNHFVICYHNHYTIEVTKQLREAHIPFVVIDARDDIEELAKKHKYPAFIKAEPHSELAMLKANMSSAKGLITLSDSISDNIAIIASVRLFEKEHHIVKPYYIISSAEDMNEVEKIKKLGANSVVSPTKLTAQRISSMAIRPDMTDLLEQFLNQSDTPLEMEEIFVPKYSWMVLKKLKETHIREIANVSIVGITNRDGTFVAMPKGGTLIMSESKLLVIGKHLGITIIRKIIKEREKPEELRYA
ncbi:MAG: NAD-binding protein [Campylobacterota bacterium]|nr:NAD-binding protein [Campylobacterota bacterium]